LCCYGSVAVAAGPFSVLHSFAGQPDGALPSGRIVVNKAGNIYGTTLAGGSADFGSIFEVTTAKSYSNIVSMQYPIVAGLSLTSKDVVLGASGSAYPTCGSLYSLSSSNVFNVFYTFGNVGKICSGSVYSSVAQNKAGEIFGGYYTCGSYDNNGCTSFAGGIFQYNINGTVTLLDQSHNEPGYSAYEYFADRGGKIWVNNYSRGIFSFPRNGKVTVLSSGTTNGLYASFVENAAGNLFGVDAASGRNGNSGDVFEIINPDTPNPNLIVLHSFSGTDGSDPEGDVAIDKSGNLFGTTFEGGKYNFGTLYEISAAGVFSSLYSFSGGKDGQYPYSGVVIGKDGAVYGTTYRGGSSNNGVVFRYKP
jgi:uncharacterized repeat protein (TIGR03803 family)